MGALLPVERVERLTARREGCPCAGLPSKIDDWSQQREPDKNSTGGLWWMGTPGGFAAYTAGMVDGKSRRLCSMYRRGTRTVLGPTVRRPPTFIGQPTVPAQYP